MTNLKLTPWFDGTIKPVRVGVYMADFYLERKEWYSFWDGDGWGWLSLSVEMAQEEYERKGKIHDFGEIAWRGLAEDPNK